MDDILLESDGKSLTGSSFVDAKTNNETDLPIFDDATKWLDGYFAGQKPDWCVRYSFCGSTEFQKKVFALLSELKYGETISYFGLKNRYIERYHVKNMSSQAIGHAVGSNPLVIFIPCHRVIKKDGTIGGFAFHLKNKEYMLTLEGSFHHEKM